MQNVQIDEHNFFIISLFSSDVISFFDNRTKNKFDLEVKN